MGAVDSQGVYAECGHSSGYVDTHENKHTALISVSENCMCISKRECR